jgi:uncharacterized protein (TIGR03067 family)
LAISFVAVPIRADDTEAKAALPVQVKKEGVFVRVPDSYTFALALSADGKLLARAGINKVDLWDVASGKELHTLKGTWNAFYAEHQVATDSSQEDIAQAEKDMESLQGTWRESKLQKVVVRGDRLSRIDSRPGQEETITGLITIDPKTKAIDWPMETGLAAGVTWRGIYELKGDNLRIIFIGAPTPRRPKTFDEKDGFLLVLKREKPTAPTKLPKEPEKPAAEKTRPEQNNDAETKAAEDKAVAAITKLGGQVTRDEKAAGKPVVAVSLSSVPVTDAALAELLKDLKNLETLDLFKTKVTDAGLKELQGLNNLRSLSLGFTKVSDKGIKELKHLKSLNSLSLNNNTGITDAGLDDLAELENLQTLDLTATAVTDAGLKALRACNKLQWLVLAETKVTDAGLKEINGIESLQILWLSNCQISDAGLKELKGLKNLERLRLDNTKVTGAGLAELAELSALFHLGLSHAPVTDAGLKGLKEFKTLRRLDLDRTLVTDAGLKELHDLKTLQTLSLSETKVTDLGLKDLQAIVGLQELYVGSTRLTDAGIKRLQAALPDLRIMR